MDAQYAGAVSKRKYLEAVQAAEGGLAVAESLRAQLSEQRELVATLRIELERCQAEYVTAFNLVEKLRADILKYEAFLNTPLEVHTVTRDDYQTCRFVYTVPGVGGVPVGRTIHASNVNGSVTPLISSDGLTLTLGQFLVADADAPTLGARHVQINYQNGNRIFAQFRLRLKRS